ncbi:MAG TPA: DUF3160 domain-containing protein, partial [Verrucomicrobiae bacterium]
MHNKWRYLSAVLVATSLVLTSNPTYGASYDLRSVKGIDSFSGSVGARELLAKNGFVVADPTFKQIFEPYIKSPQIEGYSQTNPMGVSLPAFITTDSAWHTYHVMLEEGVKDMEKVESQRLFQFSEQLLAAAKQQQAGNDLVSFASIGLALQDEHHRQTLPPVEKRIVDALKNGSGAIAVPIGFQVSAAQFRAQSFYTQSPELSGYFTARQWYATVLFRLNNPRETKMAIVLSRLVNGNPHLLALWKQLSEPFDTFLAHAEDGTIREYGAASITVLGTNYQSLQISDSQMTEIQKALDKQVGPPRVNDQWMSPEQYVQFGKEGRGFRLLPPRQLPCAICFQETVEPRIPNRTYPSGLDFIAASSVLRSPAAVRAVQSEFGKSVADLIVKTDCGPLPDSLHGEAMQLLAILQQPLPAKVPAPLRTDAWQDLQLWTQLGAWAEQRHTWALHSKMSVEVMGMISPPKGMVAPYPDFFAGLAKLSRRTAEAFQHAGLDPEFDPKGISDQLLKLLDIEEKGFNEGNVMDLMQKYSGEFEQLGALQNRYYEKQKSELEKVGSRNVHKQIQNGLRELAQRGSTGHATPNDIEMLRIYFDSRPNIARLLTDFAPVCDRLAQLAKKSQDGEHLTDDDDKWIQDYGVTLAGFSFYYGDSYEVPRDDFPIVTRVFSNPVGNSMLYAGLARPQALYIIIPVGKTLQLYRGAVMTYREFIRPNDKLLDDESWRDLISKGQTPPAPPFTKSFYAETSVTELLQQLLQQLRAQSSRDNPNYGETRDLLWQINARATAEDLPPLLEFLTHTKADENGESTDELASIIARLPWKSHEKEMVKLLASDDYTLANAAARVLMEQPAILDASALASNFAAQPVRTRRLYCRILSKLPRQTDTSRQMFLRALHDKADGVRWQAALAIGNSRWNDDQSRTALLKTVDDTNELVGAAAVHALVKLGVTNAAPIFLQKLKGRVQLPVSTSEERSTEAKAILQDIQGEENHATGVLDDDHLSYRIEMTVTPIMLRRKTMRVPPMPLPMDMSLHNYNIADELIDALGGFAYSPAAEELVQLRGTEYDIGATRALGKIAPDQLVGGLLKTALNKDIDSYLREQALVTLADVSATNHVRDLAPLLEDTTPIE